MTYVRNLDDWTPPARFDGLPFTQALIQESATEGGTFSTIETKSLSPVDSDPSDPATRDFTTTLATLDPAWYRITWKDASGSTFVGDARYSDDDDLTSVLGKIRLEIGDTDEDNQLFSDAEIQVYIDNRTSVDSTGGTTILTLAAAADLCDVLATRFAREYDFSTDGQSFSRGQMSAHYSTRAQELRMRSGSGMGSIQLVSGVNAAIDDAATT